MELLERTHARPVDNYEIPTTDPPADLDQQPLQRHTGRLIEAGRDAIAATLSEDPAEFLESSRQPGAE